MTGSDKPSLEIRLVVWIWGRKRPALRGQAGGGNERLGRRGHADESTRPLTRAAGAQCWLVVTQCARASEMLEIHFSERERWPLIKNT